LFVCKPLHQRQSVLAREYGLRRIAPQNQIFAGLVWLENTVDGRCRRIGESNVTTLGHYDSFGVN
jgi:hypothetical protein